jgi:hypothetical protein
MRNENKVWSDELKTVMSGKTMYTFEYAEV